MRLLRPPGARLGISHQPYRPRTSGEAECGQWVELIQPGLQYRWGFVALRQRWYGIAFNEHRLHKNATVVSSRCAIRHRSLPTAFFPIVSARTFTVVSGGSKLMTSERSSLQDTKPTSLPALIPRRARERYSCTTVLSAPSTKEVERFAWGSSCQRCTSESTIEGDEIPGRGQARVT